MLNKILKGLTPRFIKENIKKLKGFIYFQEKKIDFLIIGAQKCGTTALFNFLCDHPLIVGSNKKELNFFNDNDKFMRGYNYYHSFFPKWKKSKYYFEASPSYLQDNNFISCERIYNYNPNIKLLILVRNPIERAYSAFQMYKKRWNKNPNWYKDRGWRVEDINYEVRSERDYNNFDYFINHELEVLKQNKRIDSPVINHGKYIIGIQEYLKYFDFNQILIIPNYKLKKSTYVILNKIIKFLEVPDTYNNWSFPNGKMIFKGKYKDEISRNIKDVLENVYKPYNNELYNLIGEDLNW